MNPHKMNKVDISSMSLQDQQAFQKYGKIPSKNLLTKMQKDRKYFDSGDYMMQKAGVAAETGTAIPTPQGVPHASPPTTGNHPGSLSSSPTGGTQPVHLPSIGERALSPDRSTQSGGGGQTGSGGVGVGISPAATSEAMEVPGRHMRRGSESGNQARISPPATMRENSQSSSYPIHHTSSFGQQGGFGSSPVKSSNLANRLDEEMEG